MYIGGQAQVEKSSFSIVLGLQIRWLRSLVLLKVRTRLAGVLILWVKRGFRIQKGTWNHEFAPNLLSFSPRSPPLSSSYIYCHFLTVWGLEKFVWRKAFPAYCSSFVRDSYPVGAFLVVVLYRRLRGEDCHSPARLIRFAARKRKIGPEPFSAKFLIGPKAIVLQDV
uniref:Uncharacterized protein n=1 Tax=Solanum lycopersicum TaxID=4081 RepID=A0A3Q7J4Z2_SOLLC